MPASPESTPPDFKPSHHSEDQLFTLLGGQNQTLVGFAKAELERRRNAREDKRVHHVARTARAAAWAAGFSALGALVTTVINVIRLLYGR
jgi:hypothetical protein